MSQAKPLNQFKKRAFDSLLSLWRKPDGAGKDASIPQFRPDMPDEELGDLHDMMQQCLSAQGGEISQRQHSVELGLVYKSLNDVGRARFLKLLAEDFALDHSTIRPLVEAYEALDNQSQQSRWEQQMRDALISPRSRILKRFTALPNGFKFLVDMRAELLNSSPRRGEVRRGGE